VAIIPAAGLGKRMASVTGGGAKELVPICGIPIIDRVIAEAQEAGATEVIIVSSPAKADLNHHLSDYRLVMQERAEGFAVATWLGIQAAEPAARYLLLLPDTLYFPQSPSTALGGLESDFCVAVEVVGDDAVERYGIVEESGGEIQRILEKPKLDQTLSRLAVSARYAFGPAFIDVLSAMVTGRGGTEELSLTPVVNEACKAGLRCRSLLLSPEQSRLDCGVPEGYHHALEVLK
jgi:UTP-glucose-1-phosphate uridylyltransferase